MRVQCRRPVTGLRPSGRRSRPLRLRSRRAAQVKLPVKAPNVARHSSATCSASDSVEESGSARRSEGQDVGVPIIPNVAAEWAPDSASGLQMNHQLMTGLTLTTLFGMNGGGGSNGGGGHGGDGGGGGHGGFENSHLNPLFDVAEDEDEEEEYTDEEFEEEEAEGEGRASGIQGALEEDEDEEEEEDEDESDGETGPNDDLTRKDDLATNEFFVDEILTEGLPEGFEGVPTKEELFAGCRTQPGFVCTKADLSADAKNFRYSGVFQDIQVRTVEKDDKTVVVFKFIGMDAPPPKTLSVSSHKASQKLTLPSSQIEKARALILGDDKRFDAKKMFQLKHCLEEWYRKQGYTYCYVTQVDGMETGNLKVKLLEGRVGRISVTQVSAEGKPTGKTGNIPEHVLTREIPFQANEIYHQDMPQKCLREVFGLGLHETMSVGCKQSMKDETKFDIELQVKERPAKTADVELEWPIALTAGGRPGLATLIPGGSLTWENGNLLGKGRLLSASATTSNFLNPTEDLGYQLTYRHPDLKGPDDPKRTELNASVFNTRNQSAVFSAGAGKDSDNFVGVMVDRVGAKIAVSEQLARNSKLTYGAVLEQVSNLDDNGELMAAGAKGLPTGELDRDGPPTCLGTTGRDRLGFLQANLIRDTSYFLHGTQLGNRQIFQVEQGLFLGPDRPLFNRARLTATHFHQIGKASPGEAPKSLVVHGKAGGCIGDQPPYDLFTLGGPFSVRGYQVGEVAAARAFLEGALELRLPWKGRRFYTFAEGASDLGTSKLVLGNPTGYFDKPGSATSFGAGVKLGAARLEVASEGLSALKVFNVRFGERF